MIEVLRWPTGVTEECRWEPVYYCPVVGGCVQDCSAHRHRRFVANPWRVWIWWTMNHPTTVTENTYLVFPRMA